MIKTSRVALSSTPAVLNTATEADASTGQSVIVQCPADMFIGGPDVTSANGFKVSAGVPFTLDLQRASALDEKLYAVLASGTAEASVLQQGV